MRRANRAAALPHVTTVHRHHGQCEVIDLHQLQPRNVRKQRRCEQCQTTAHRDHRPVLPRRRTDCEAGKYGAVAGASVCDDCPGDRFSTPGATSCDLCNAGFYYDIDQTCVVCPDGPRSDGRWFDARVADPKRYWRIDATSDDIFRCPIDGAALSHRFILGADSE